MKSVIVIGTLFETTGQILHQILQNLHLEGEISHRIRIVGEEISHESPKWEIFAYELSQVKNSGQKHLKPNWQFEGEYFGALTECEKELQMFILLLNEKGIDYDFDYWEQNEQGETVGDIVTWKSYVN